MSDDDDDAAEATLELTILLLPADGRRHRSPSFFPSKPKPFAVAWIDPAAKRSTRALSPGDPNSMLHFPLSFRALSDPGSTLTVQILSSRFPFRGAAAARLEGSAVVPLSSLPAASGDTLTLPLRRPSSRPVAFVRLYARILWCLGTPPPLQASPSMERSDCVPVVASGWSQMDSLQMEFSRVEPNAPPLPVENGRKPPPLQAAFTMQCPDWVPVESMRMEFSRVESNSPPVPAENGKNNGAWRSFLVGLASGTLAAVLVGAAGLAED